MVDFWPESLTGYAQAAGPILTVAAVYAAFRAINRNGKWRHEDYCAQRQVLASHLVVEHDTKPHGISGFLVYMVRLLNTGTEVVKDVSVQVIAADGDVAEMAVGVEKPVNATELTCGHLMPTGHQDWKIVSDVLPTVKVDGEHRHVVTMRVRWTDAAGWHWQMENNREPVCLDRSTQAWFFRLRHPVQAYRQWRARRARAAACARRRSPSCR